MCVSLVFSHRLQNDVSLLLSLVMPKRSTQSTFVASRHENLRSPTLSTNAGCTLCLSLGVQRETIAEEWVFLKRNRGRERDESSKYLFVVSNRWCASCLCVGIRLNEQVEGWAAGVVPGGGGSGWAQDKTSRSALRRTQPTRN